MIATPHLLVGAAVGAATGNAPIGFVAGFVSHFVLDYIPHAEVSMFVKPGQRRQRLEIAVSLIDVPVGLALLLIATAHGPCRGAAWAGALGGILPDAICYVPLWNKRLAALRVLKPLFAFHDRVHGDLPRSKWVLGVAIQAALAAMGFLFILKGGSAS